MSDCTPPRVAAVVFDNDGLLLDTESAWTRAEAILYERRGVTFTLAHKQELLGTSGAIVRATLERHLAAPGEGARLVDELHPLVEDELRREAAPQPGALDLLAALRAAGTPIGLASNSPRVLVDLALRTAALTGTFAATVTADEVAEPKPAPDVYARCCALLGADPTASVALEDSPTGVAAAVAAGMRVAGVPSLEGVSLAAADLVASSLADPAVWELCGLRANARSTSAA